MKVCCSDKRPSRSAQSQSTDGSCQRSVHPDNILTVEAYKAVGAVDPNNANAYFRMGQAANAADDTDAAEEAPVKAKELDEHNNNVDRQLSTYIKEGCCLPESKRYQKVLWSMLRSL